MTSLPNPWNVLAHPLMILFVGLLALTLVFVSRRLFSNQGSVVKVFGVAMATYIFTLLAIAELGGPRNPSISQLISLGIGEARFANLLIGFVALGIFDLTKILLESPNTHYDYIKNDILKLQSKLKGKVEESLNTSNDLKQAKEKIASLERDLAAEKELNSIDKVRARLMMAHYKQIHNFVYIGISVIFVLVLLSSVRLFEHYFSIDPIVLAAIVGGVAVAIVGLLGTVSAGLFGIQKK